MKREVRDYINDIADAIAEIGDFTRGMDFAAFAADKKTTNAVIRSLEVLGEAANHISPEIATAHPAIPWKQMRAMRNKLSHEYFGVDLEIVWAVVSEELPPLKPHIEQLRQKGQTPP
ncbi:MAG: DUF86 domain-containing protein [Planctomycetota bacterium]